MKAVLLFLGAALCSLPLLSQDVPLIKVGETELGVSKLYVDVVVVGNRMSTTYDMYFYNPSNEILEGELSFPLGEKQTVSRFALEVNGKLREAVAVEKELGRVTFEAVVRRRVDPALLEKGTGNNYKARIYPIPAEGFKRVVLTYEEELSISNNKQLIKLPLFFTRKLQDFKLVIEVNGRAVAPKIVSRSKIKSIFKRIGENYVLEFSAKQFKPSQKFVAEIPLDETIMVLAYEDYTYAYHTISTSMIERKKPGSVKLFWDVSYSMQERDLEKELALLDAYFEEMNSGSVQLVTFSDVVILNKNFRIESGDWFKLKKILEDCIYDGATSYDSLFTGYNKHDELLVFTDGMNTLSDFPISKTRPLFIVNSIQKANHNSNKNFGESNNGGYINLVDKSIEDAMTMLRYLPLKFLGMKSNNRLVDFYPKSGAVVFNDFSFAAKGLKTGEEVELLFGYGEVITLKKKFRVPASTGFQQLPRIWAQKKVRELEKFGDEKRDPIIEIAIEYNLVTNFTSLIVLETLDDYKRFAIAPPKELLEEYMSALNKKTKITENVDRSKEERKDISESSVVESVEMDTNELRNGENATVSGSVSDSFGLPLSGVNVIIEGKPVGTQTDFNGNFSIEAPAGDKLVFSYLGFVTLETTVKGNSTMNIRMQEDVESLSEVVVVGYGGVSNTRKSRGYAVSSLEAKDFSETPEADIVRAISGKVPGAKIIPNSGVTGSGTNFTIRSMSSINGNNQPLFIVDGIPFDASTNQQGGFAGGTTVISSRFLDLDPNMIESVQVLKGLSAAVLYGQQGRNGVVIITTKNNTSSGSDRSSSNYYIRIEAEREEMAKQRRELMKEKTLKEMGFTTDYLEELQNAIGKEDIYALYLNQRENYRDYPSYFIDVYDFFRNANAKYANRILSNIIEIDNDNYELLRVYAYKSEEKGDFDTATFIYRQVLKLRSEDAQSYRDLALALIEIGSYDEALLLLIKILDKEFYDGNHRRDFEEIKPIVINEIKNLIFTKRLTGMPDNLPKEVFSKNEMDIRVVIDWNHNDTDIDLHIVDPNLEVCFYGNDKTKMGGKLSEDMTEGFGPEEFSLENAVSGSYYIKVDYFGDEYQKVENPTFMKVSIYQNYGTKEQKRRIKVIRLTEGSDQKLVDRIALL